MSIRSSAIRSVPATPGAIGIPRSTPSRIRLSVSSPWRIVTSEHSATISVEASWALNIADPNEAVTYLCGDKAGADMRGGLHLNYVKYGRQCIETPNFEAGGVAFFEGATSDPSELEARAFINAIINDTEVSTKPEQALVVTQILEGIYESAKQGKPFYFE